MGSGAALHQPSARGPERARRRTNGFCAQHLLGIAECGRNEGQDAIRRSDDLAHRQDAMGMVAKVQRGDPNPVAFQSPGVLASVAVGAAVSLVQL